MNENRRKLEERGERLKNLEDKSAGLENAASDFASMAKQLKQQQSNPFRLW
jgi:hypothetical protein